MPPQTLYKYRTWDQAKDPHGRDILTDNILYFARASSFNDPFEARIHLRFELSPVKWLRDAFIATLRKENPHTLLTEIEAAAELYVSSKNYLDPQIIESNRKEQYDYRTHQYGICSLTEDEKSIVMWAHYADNHTGYCVGLDFQALKTYKNSPESVNLLYDIYRVNYTKGFPILIPSEMDVEEYSISPLKLKSHQWKYEQEWRIIAIGGSNQVLRIPDDIITMIILGCDMLPEQRDLLKGILRTKSSQIELYEAVRKENSFGLDINKLET